MRQQPPTKNPHIPHTDHQIPQKVTRREPLHHAPGPRVPPHAALHAHGAPLRVRPHDPQGQPVDEHRLRQRDDVHVPVELGAGVEGRVGGREELGGEVGGEAGADEVVGCGGEEELVDVEGEGGEGEVGC